MLTVQSSKYLNLLKGKPGSLYGPWGLALAGLLLGATSCGELPANLSSEIPFLNPYKAQLADHLTATGAKMYGAYWCPHCENQRKEFGRASARMPYVECDPQGLNSQASLCQTKGITAYPTWEINGAFYVGGQPLGKLAELSGFVERQ